MFGNNIDGEEAEKQKLIYYGFRAKFYSNRLTFSLECEENSMKLKKNVARVFPLLPSFD